MCIRDRGIAFALDAHIVAAELGEAGTGHIKFQHAGLSVRHKLCAAGMVQRRDALRRVLLCPDVVHQRVGLRHLQLDSGTDARQVVRLHILGRLDQGWIGDVWLRIKRLLYVQQMLHLLLRRGLLHLLYRGDLLHGLRLSLYLLLIGLRIVRHRDASFPYLL